MIEINGNGAEFTVAAEVIAEGLKLEASLVPGQLQSGAIKTACEAGVGEDEGRFRLTFSNAHTRLRLIVDSAGAIVSRSVLDFGSQPLPPGARKPGAV